MHRQSRSRCSVDDLRRPSKVKDLRKCPFCTQPRILSTNLFLFQTVSTINELQNYPYKKTMQSLIEEKKKNIQYIDYKYIMEYLPDQEIETLEEYLPKKACKRKSSEVIEFYKYYQDLPRVFIGDTENILNSYYTSKRFVFYRGLKKQLGIQMEVSDKQKEKEREKERYDLESHVLKGLTVEEEKEDSLSWSVLLMQKKLAKAIKNTEKSSKASSRKGIDKIDKQYSFNRLLGNRVNEVLRIKGFEDVSNINPDIETVKSPKLFDASNKLDFRTLFLKKNISKELTAKKSPHILKHKKQKSMEDIPKVLRTSLFDSTSKKKMIGSAVSSQLKLQSPIKKTETTQYKELKRYSSGGFRSSKKNSHKKLFASGDVSCFPPQKLNTSQEKKNYRTKGHHRMASEQVEPGKKLMGNWTPDNRMRITINQQNVVHILLGQPQKTKISRKPKR